MLASVIAAAAGAEPSGFEQLVTFAGSFLLAAVALALTWWRADR